MMTTAVDFSGLFRGHLLSILQQKPVAWPSDSSYADFFLEACEKQELAAFFYYFLRKALAETQNGCPEEIRFQIQREAGRQALVEASRLTELRGVLHHFTQKQLQTLVLKGAALAYSLYPEPSLRSRCDTDLWVEEKDRAAAGRGLESLGYAAENVIHGTLVSYQAMYTKTDALGLEHIVDLHWKILNPQSHANLLTFSEAAAEKIPIPSLSPAAYGLSLRHALLYACHHLRAHHPDEDFFLWDYDLLLLEQALHKEPGRFERFLEFAAQKGSGEIVKECLNKAKRFLRDAPLPAVARPVGKNTRLRQLASDLRVLSWPQKRTLLKEHLFPPADYMQRKYSVTRLETLPFYYLGRILRGIPKLFL